MATPLNENKDKKTMNKSLKYGLISVMEFILQLKVILLKLLMVKIQLLQLLRL